MSSHTCSKCGTPLAFAHGLVCHWCHPKLAEQNKATPDYLADLERKLTGGVDTKEQQR